MAEAIHVDGEARVKVGTGAAGALEILGVSVDGVDIEERDHTEPIFTDTFGPMVPFDEQSFLSSALIRVELVFYDEPVLAKVRGRISGVDGRYAKAGALWGAGSKYFRLLIDCQRDSFPRNYLNARLLDSYPVKVGTRKSVWHLTFFAKGHQAGAGETDATVLRNTVAT